MLARFRVSIPVALSLLITACGGQATQESPAVQQATPETSPVAETPTPTIATLHGELSLTLVAEGLDLPTSFTDLGNGVLLVGEQKGAIRQIENDALLAEPFLDLTDRVLAAGERGLLGIAAHPDYANDRRLFVAYSNLEGHTELREFGPDGERLLLMIPQYSEWHQAGHVMFGPDAYLYMSVGDDHRTDTARANPGEIYGTILRLDVNAGDQRYAIPDDNPFAHGGGKPEVWDYGLRNPWRFGFDTLTGDLYIGDVGLDDAEEVNLHPAGTPGGLDFGWTASEGDYCRVEGCDLEGVTVPVHWYDHSEGECGVIGGHVIRTDHALDGHYVFGDLCSGRIWSMPADDPGSPEVQLESELRISSIGVDRAGDLYVLVHWGNGRVYRLTD